jgi:hypothetical protein
MLGLDQQVSNHTSNFLLTLPILKIMAAGLDFRLMVRT